MGLFSITDIIRITGLSDRTLRNFIKDRVLLCEKINGKWHVSTEQIIEFIKHPDAIPSLKSKMQTTFKEYINSIETDTLIEVGDSGFLYVNLPNVICENLAPSIDILIEGTKSGKFSAVVSMLNITKGSSRIGVVILGERSAWLETREKILSVYSLSGNAHLLK